MNSKTQYTRAKPEPRGLALRRILVPLDFSGKSRQALRFAIPLAQRYGARISLVHAVEHPVYPEAFGSLAIDVVTPGQAAQARMAEMAARMLPAGLAGETIVCYGSASGNICASADDLNADLIVISTHGRTGLSRGLLGSTAERVVRYAHCSVLTVRRRAEAGSLDGLKEAGDRPPWQRILVPLDFSLSSLRALGVAVDLAEDSGARLLMLHVAESALGVTGPDGAALAVPSPLAFERAKAELPRVARQFVPASIRCTTTVMRGQPAEAILETARAKGIDLILLAAQGRTGLERFLLGSTAERVVRRASCPVWAVRHRRRNLNESIPAQSPHREARKARRRIVATKG